MRTELVAGHQVAMNRSFAWMKMIQKMSMKEQFLVIILGRYIAPQRIQWTSADCSRFRLNQNATHDLTGITNSGYWYGSKFNILDLDVMQTLCN